MRQLKLEIRTEMMLQEGTGHLGKMTAKDPSHHYTSSYVQSWFTSAVNRVLIPVARFSDRLTVDM